MIHFIVVTLVVFSANQIQAQEDFNYAITNCTKYDTFPRLTNVPDERTCAKFYKCNIEGASIQSEFCQAGTIYEPGSGLCVNLDGYDCPLWHSQVCFRGVPGSTNFASTCCNYYYEYTCGSPPKTSFRKCENDGEFDINTKQCQLKGSARTVDGCSTCKPSNDVCEFRRDHMRYVDECTFIKKGTTMPLRCAPGTYLESPFGHCGCVALSGKCVILPKVCGDQQLKQELKINRVNNEFFWNVPGMKPRFIYTNATFGNTGREVTFSDNTGFTIYYLQGNSYFQKNNLVISLTFTPASVNGNRIIMSNKGSNCDGPTFELKLTTRSIVFTLHLGDQTAEVSVPYSQQSGEVKISIRMSKVNKVDNQWELKARARFSRDFNAGVSDSASEFVTIENPANLKSTCPLSVGYFTGTLSMLNMWWCDGDTSTIFTV